jgi:hypothetical protein
MTTISTIPEPHHLTIFGPYYVVRLPNDKWFAEAIEALSANQATRLLFEEAQEVALQMHGAVHQISTCS